MDFFEELEARIPTGKVRTRSANAVITVLAEYGLQHMQLKSRTVQEVGFGD